MSLLTLATAQLLRALPRKTISQAVGKLCEAPWPDTLSKAAQSAYCKAYNVDMSDVDTPAEGYRSFDAFFTRSLKPGARPVDDDAVLSPADGDLAASGTISEGLVLTVKDKPYSVGDLIGDPDGAKRYQGGQFAVVYLSPRDYHRVHCPVEGRQTLVRSILGDLYPVNTIGQRHIEGLFVRNQRVAIVIDTEQLGQVILVMIGATIVGRITVSCLEGSRVPVGLHYLNPACPIKKGDEIGIFHLGSTVVLLLESGVTISRAPGKVRYGESLLRGSR